MPVSCLFRNMVSCRFHAGFMGYETTPVSWAWNHGFRQCAGLMLGFMLGFMLTHRNRFDWQTSLFRRHNLSVNQTCFPKSRLNVPAWSTLWRRARRWRIPFRRRDRYGIGLLFAGFGTGTTERNAFTLDKFANPVLFHCGFMPVSCPIVVLRRISRPIGFPWPRLEGIYSCSNPFWVHVGSMVVSCWFHAPAWYFAAFVDQPHFYGQAIIWLHVGSQLVKFPQQGVTSM